LNSIYRIWIGLQQNRFVRPPAGSQTYAHQRLLCDELKKQITQNDLIFNLMVVFNNDDIVYTPDGIFSKMYWVTKYSVSTIWDMTP